VSSVSELKEESKKQYEEESYYDYGYDDEVEQQS
jgi:hypothetical protein